MKKELLIGCGSNREKKLWLGENKDWSNLTTLDIEPSHNPNVTHDLNIFPYPLDPNQFDEIHAYEVLEHCGMQGDYKFFFAQFSELWRILKPDGLLIGTVPLANSPWAWGDPSHTRVIPKESFVFLVQPEYTAQVGKTPMSDFRSIYKADFEVVHLKEEGHHLHFIIKAIKPARIN